MLIYAVTHPAQVTNRPFSVAIWAFADTPAELVTILRENLVLTAGFFCCRGNEHLILFGLPGRAAQDIALGLLLLIGIGLCLRQFSRMEPRLLVIWFLLALIPTLLATEAPHPLRLIAAAPAMVLLTVYGMHFVAQKRRWISVVFTLWLIVGGGLTFRDYFVRWPARTDMQAVFGYSLIKQAETIRARTREGEVIYIPQPLYVKPALHYYLNGPFPPQPSPAFNETTPQVTFLGELDNPAWVRLSSQGAQILPPLTQTARYLLAESGAGARIDARQLAWQKPAVASDDQIGPAKLSGATFSPIIPEDGGLEVTLFWEALAPMDEDYEILVHLLDDAGQGWSLDEMAAVKDAYPTSYWRTGRDLVPDFHRLRLKDELPVGRYWLAVSIFDPAQGVRLPVVVAKKQVAPDTLFLGPLKVPLATPETEVSETDFVVDQEFAGLARLRGYNLPDQHLIAGQPLSVELIWQAIAEVTTDYTVFVHLLDAGDNLVAGHDGQPVDGRYPTTIWSVGEFIPDLHVIDTTAVPPGQYHLAVGLYNFATGERIPVTGSADGRAMLNVIIEIE
jgi:hypothetical protein